MGIDGISNNQVSWQSFMNAVADAAQTEQIGGVKVEKDDKGVRFSVNEGEQTRAVTLTFPELEAPGAVDSTAVDTLVAKLADGGALDLTEAQQKAFQALLQEKLSALLSAAASEGVSTGSTSSSSVFFNLYQLMALLAAVAQELRDSTRDIRQAENEAMQSSIQAQADKQKSAALFGMIGGAIVCALQVAATTVGLAKQASAFKSQLSAQHQSGLSRAHADLKVAEMQASSSDAARNYQTKVNELGSTKAAEVLSTFEGSRNAGEAYASSKATVAHLEMRQQSLQGVEPHLATDQQLATAKADVAAARQELTTAQETLKATETQLSAKQSQLRAINERLPKEYAALTNLQEQKIAADAHVQEMQGQLKDVAQTPMAKAQLEANIASEQARSQALSTKIAARQSDIQKLQQTRDALPQQIDQLKTQQATDQAAVARAQTRVTTTEEAQRTLQQQHEAAVVARDLPKARTQLENDRLAYKAQLQSEASQARSAYEDAVANNSPDAPELKQRAELAEAYAAKELSGILTGEEKSTAIADANAAYKNADALLTHSEKFQTAQYSSDRARAFNDLVSVLGNLGQTLVRGTADIMNAEATRMTADQKAAEEELDEVKDLFAGAGDLANAVLSLMQAIQQSENDSMQEAIRA